MSHAPVHCAGLKPVIVQLKAGETYAWCACGRSGIQPFCDGSHQGTGLDPVVFVAEKDACVALCTCKNTATPPLCDGSHKQLTGAVIHPDADD
ncbi:MAG: CDGSH iron-sulfur domain-containing protein [Marinobacterium sp.]|nr:CDGSH iron-sulfur domain-containing protein [Marinobacterium sp.]